MATNLYARNLQQAYLKPYRIDVTEALTDIQQYRPLVADPTGYSWTRDHHLSTEHLITQLQCTKDVLSVADVTSFAHVLHKIRCDNILAKAHSLAHTATCTMSTNRYLTMDHIHFAKEQLQEITPGANLHLHIDPASFRTLKRIPGIDLLHKEVTDHDAYRGTFTTPGERFLIHLWVTPPTITQRGIPTTNFMTTHGGLLFQEHPASDYMKDLTEWSTGDHALIDLRDIALILEIEPRTDPSYNIHHQFSMSIGNPEAIIAFPRRAKSD